MKEDYPIFIHWYQTLGWLLDTIEKYPRNARFSLASRISDLALDILDGVIDAIYCPKSRQNTLKQINLNLEKLRVLLRLSHDRQYISTRQYEHSARAINETGSMVGGWMKTGA
ncbi:MAG: diversity-generating retroelement protein Avd [Methylococcales bacterium]|mgnify:CR=1 FL=1|nr:diversity-generating retroelement protein Avd [Methylococcales bacterium]MBT7409407.1 diversity-generating retroelement protein Avd [Methylococcales bacterium]